MVELLTLKKLCKEDNMTLTLTIFASSQIILMRVKTGQHWNLNIFSAMHALQSNYSGVIRKCYLESSESKCVHAIELIYRITFFEISTS